MAVNSLIKNTLFMYVRMIFVLGVSLFSSRIILANLGVDDFGIYNLVGGIIILASFIANTLRDGIQRFYSYDIGKNNFESLNLTFSTSLSLHILVSFVLLIISVIGYWFIPNYLNIPTDRMEDALWVYTFSTFSMIISLCTIPHTALVVSYEKFDFIAILGIVEAVLKLIVAYAIPLFGKRLIGYSVLILLIAIFSALANIIYVKYKFRLISHRLSFDKKRLKELTTFSGWNMFGAFSNLFISNGTNIVLGMFFTPAVCAARGIAYQVMVAVRQFTTNFQTVLNPQIIKEYAAKNYNTFFKLIFKGCRINLLLFTFISIPLAFYIDYVLKLWLGSYPELSNIFVIYVFMIAALEAISYPLTSAIRANGDIIKYQVISGLIISSSVFFNYYLLKVCNDPVSVFISNIVFTFVALVGRFIIVHQKIKYPIKYFVDFLLRSMLTVFIQLCGVFIIHYFIQSNLFGIFIGYIVNFLVVFYIGLEKEERDMVIVMLLNKIKKERHG